MKILRVFGIVAGIHLFFFITIFANPGCSSSSKPTPASESVARADTPAPVVAPAPLNFNPDAPAAAAPGGNGVRYYPPTRPDSPAASTLVVEPVKNVTPTTTYTVKSGDSLWSIANKHKISYQELAAVNNLKTNAALQPGQKLIIPDKSAPKGANTAPAGKSEATTGTKASDTTAAKSGVMKHTVKSGETLGSIAVKYGVRQKDLAVANNITDPLKLPVGKELVIPGWDAASGKPSGKSSTKSGSAAPKTEAPPDAAPVLQPAPVLAPQPAPASDVPVIRVDEAPRKP